MSFYRDVYLNSEEWKNIRLAKIHQGKYTCALCKRKNIPFDVHHLQYKELYNVNVVRDLRVLCRPCHDKVHDLMRKYPKLKKLPPPVQWEVVRSHFGVDREIIKDNLAKERHVPKKLKPHDWQRRFGWSRNILVSARVVYRRAMIWDDRLLSARTHPQIPLLFITEYIQLTGTDPRRSAHRINPARLLTFPVA